MEYEYGTAPFAHQEREFLATRDRKSWGLFWEMGCGKTKVLVDTAAWLFERGEIRGLLVLAPEGVHDQWVDSELPLHLPRRVREEAQLFAWNTGKSISKRFKEAWRSVLDRPVDSGLTVLSMTFSSLMTERGALAVRDFVDSRPCLGVLDESSAIMTPGAKVTKRCRALAARLPYRRIANGTPVADSPFEAYSQIRWLDPAAFHHLGIRDAQGFRTYFGDFVKRRNAAQGRWYPELKGYRNLDKLSEIVSAHSSRLLKRDVFPDLPPKLYSVMRFDPTAAQRRLARELREEFVALLDSGETVTADLAIVRWTRFQQVASGYLPADEDEDLRMIMPPSENPRLKALSAVLRQVEGKAIIWAKYTADVDLICDLLREAGLSFVRWDGRVSREDRAEARRSFLRDDGARFFVSKPSSSAGRGLNLQVARTVIYYNNSFVLKDREQSEDRAHRPGIHEPVQYVDLVARGTIDEKILDSLRTKRGVSAQVTRDDLADWIPEE